MAIEVDDSLTIPDAELVERFTPSGGPGGQHANRSATRVELSWDVTSSEAVNENQRRLLLEFFGPVARVVVDDERSQHRNRALAEERLAGRIRAALVPPRQRRATRPTAGSTRRRLADKRRRSEQKRLRRKPGREE